MGWVFFDFKNFHEASFVNIVQIVTMVTIEQIINETHNPTTWIRIVSGGILLESLANVLFVI